MILLIWFSKLRKCLRSTASPLCLKMEVSHRVVIDLRAQVLRQIIAIFEAIQQVHHSN